MKYLLRFIWLGLFYVSVLQAQDGIIKHTVQRGETVIGIAQQYKVTPNDLYRVNPGLMEEGLKADTVINVPSSQVRPRPVSTPAETPTRTGTTSVQNESSGGVIYHTVMQGETKYGLSRRYGLTIDELEEQNPQIKSMLMAGQRLTLKGARDNAPKPATPSTTVVDMSQMTSYVVQPGETLWGLSRRYGVTVDDLLNANKANWTGVLRSGQTLLIPAKGSATTQTAVATASTSASDVYVVQPGETKYGLSRRFNMTIDQLEELNPHIKPMLQSGHRIVTKLSGSVQATTPTPTPVVQTPVVREEPVTQPATPAVPVTPSSTQATSWGIYEVMPGETLYGLSRKSGATIDEILEKNPELKDGLRSGMKIKLPGGETAVASVTPSPQPVSQAAEVRELTRPTGLLATLNKVEAKKITVVLPFEESELQASLNSSNASTEIKQFSGIKMALDSLNRLGVNAEIEYVNSLNPKSLEKITDKASAVLVVSATDLSDKISSTLQKNNIPVITFNNSNAAQSNAYAVIPQMHQVRDKMIQYLKFQNAEIVVVTNGTKNRPEHLWVKDHQDFKVIEANVNGTLDESQLRKLLSKQKKTFVLMDTNRQGVYLNVTNVLLKESADKDIQLVSLLPREQLLSEGVSEIRFKVLKLMYPSFNANPKANFNQGLTAKYQSAYGLPISYEAVSGFDAGFDALVRIFQSRSFASLAKDEVTEQTAHRFQFIKSESGGYQNNEIYLYQYSDSEVSIPVKF